MSIACEPVEALAAQQAVAVPAAPALGAAKLPTRTGTPHHHAEGPDDGMDARAAGAVAWFPWAALAVYFVSQHDWWWATGVGAAVAHAENAA